MTPPAGLPRSLGWALITIGCLGAGPFGILACSAWTDPIDFRSTSSDEDTDPVRTFTSGSFGAPELAAMLSSPEQDLDLTLTADEMEIYFVRLQEGVGNIYTSNQRGAASAWSVPEVVTDLSRNAERDPEISGDGLRMGLSSIRAGAPNHNDLYEATRPRRNAPWSLPFVVAELSTPNSECCGTTDDKSELMIFVSDAAGSLDLYEARRDHLGAAWGDAQPLAELNGPADDSNPHLRAAGLVVLFDSDRSEEGARDLYIATRTSLSAPFEPPILLSDVNTASDERDGWLSADGRHLYFSSDRSGDFEIYLARR